MKQYIRAELAIHKKNGRNPIFAFSGLAVFVLLLLFTGVGEAGYCVAVTLVGGIDFLFFMLVWYLSPAFVWRNKQKVCVPTEQLLLTLGESKRTYVKIRIFVFFVLYFGMLLLIALMQLPAFLLAGEKYTILYFGIEVVGVTAFLFWMAAILFFISRQWLILAVQAGAGFGGGFMSSMMEDFGETKQEDFRKLCVYAAVAVTVGLLGMGYRYLKTIREERGGGRRKKTGEKEQRIR